MYDGVTVGAVIPAYNEEGFVGEVIDTLPEFVDRAYVIDDRSTDETWAEIQRHAAQENERQGRRLTADGGRPARQRVVPIRHETNRGRGGAVKTGYRRALDDGMSVVAVLDGDGQMDPGILSRFVRPITSGEADYVKGNRLLDRDLREGMSAWRLFGNSVLTFLTKVASGYWQMMDPQNGYTAISVDALESLDVDGLYDDYGFLNDVLIKLNARGMRVADVPMNAEYGDETSTISYSSFVPKLSLLLFRGFLWRLKTKYLVRDFHPLVQLYALGGVSAVLGVVSVGWLLFGATLTPERGGIVALLFLLAGLFVSLAMTFDRLHNATLETRYGVTPSEDQS